eukprot:6204559-Pleurochrysis_carterae.AAC.2
MLVPWNRLTAASGHLHWPDLLIHPHVRPSFFAPLRQWTLWSTFRRSWSRLCRRCAPAAFQSAFQSKSRSHSLDTHGHSRIHGHTHTHPYDVRRTRYDVRSTTYAVRSTQYTVCSSSTRYAVRGTRYAVCGTRYAVRSTRTRTLTRTHARARAGTYTHHTTLLSEGSSQTLAHGRAPDGRRR